MDSSPEIGFNLLEMRRHACKVKYIRESKMGQNSDPDVWNLLDRISGNKSHDDLSTSNSII